MKGIIRKRWKLRGTWDPLALLIDFQNETKRFGLIHSWHLSISLFSLSHFPWFPYYLSVGQLILISSHCNTIIRFHAISLISSPYLHQPSLVVLLITGCSNWSSGLYTLLLPSSYQPYSVGVMLLLRLCPSFLPSLFRNSRDPIGQRIMVCSGSTAGTARFKRWAREDRVSAQLGI